MKIFIAIIWLLVFTKLLLFWLWLWQLKEYHWGRFKAHFETQKLRKLFFSLHGLRYPKPTKKTIIILIFGVLGELLILFYSFSLSNFLFYFLFLVLFILAPIIFSFLVLLFQIPAIILIKRTLNRARKKREQFKNLIAVGITGSYGKTSTKEFLATILSQKFKVLKTKKHINAEIGIARAILNELTAEHQIFIAEVGAYEKGKIKEVCQMLQPKIGILTGINEQHLSTFGSQENIIAGKYELIENLPEDGTAIFNGVNEYCVQLYRKTKIKKELCNGNLIQAIVENILNPDVWAEDIKIEKEFISFKAISRDGDSAHFRLNLLGNQNIENISLAACYAKKLGMTLKEISKACLKIKPEQGGIKFLKKPAGRQAGKSPTIIDSSYSANPQGVIADLDYLKLYKGKKVIIMPCLIELGPASSGIHRKIGRKINQICDLAIITTKDYFREIKQEAPNALLLEKPKEIIGKIRTCLANARQNLDSPRYEHNNLELKDFSGSEDVILLEGRAPKEVIELLK